MTTATDTRPAPATGIGATEHLYTDTTPYVITRVSESGKTMWVRRVELDETTRESRDGGGGFPLVTVQGDLTKPIGDEHKITLRKSGRWIRTGCDGSIRFTIGRSVDYADYRE